MRACATSRSTAPTASVAGRRGGVPRSRRARRHLPGGDHLPGDGDQGPQDRRRPDRRSRRRPPRPGGAVGDAAADDQGPRQGPLTGHGHHRPVGAPLPCPATRWRRRPAEDRDQGLLDDAIRTTRSTRTEPGGYRRRTAAARRRSRKRRGSTSRRRPPEPPARPSENGPSRCGPRPRARSWRDRRHARSCTPRSSATGARPLEAEVTVGEAGAVAAGPRLDAALVQGGREPAWIGAGDGECQQR